MGHPREEAHPSGNQPVMFVAGTDGKYSLEHQTFKVPRHDTLHPC